MKLDAEGDGGQIVFDSLGPNEWVMVDPFCAEPGQWVDVYASIDGGRHLAITDPLGVPVGAVAIVGSLVALDGHEPEGGVTTAPVARFQIPEDAPSGIFFVDGHWAFMVSGNKRPATQTVVLPITTLQALSDFGGRNLYTMLAVPNRRVRSYSLHRPLHRRYAMDRMRGFFQWAKTRPAGTFNYVADYDLARPEVAQSSALLLIIGRSEYWNRESREGFDRLIASGKDAILLSSETMYLEVIGSGSTRDHYAWGNAEDVKHPRSGHWADAARGYPLLPSIGPNPEDGGWYTHAENESLEWGAYTIAGASPLSEACGLRRGESLPLPSTFYDGLPLHGYRPGGVPILGELPFHRAVLIGYSYGEQTPKQRIGAWLAFQRTRSSGRCVHFGSYSWSDYGLTGKTASGRRPIEIVEQTIEALASGKDLFG